MPDASKPTASWAWVWFSVSVAIAAVFIPQSLSKYHASDVSRSYQCGVLRALRNRDNMGPTDSEDEKNCTRLQQAGWSEDNKRFEACLNAAGWGNYLSPTRKMSDQERCWKEEMERTRKHDPHGRGKT